MSRPDPADGDRHGDAGVDAAARSRAIGQRAAWAARAFSRYDQTSVLRIARAVAEQAYRQAGHLAALELQETGSGVLDHKARKIAACSVEVLETYRDRDFVSPHLSRPAAADGVVEVPHPVGVILAATPALNPVGTVFYEILLAVLTRNVIIVDAPAGTVRCAVEGARSLALAAVLAGAPDGAIQVVDHTSTEWPVANQNGSGAITDALVTHAGAALILTTGLHGLSAAAAALAAAAAAAAAAGSHRSGARIIDLDPGPVPVAIDATADLDSAADLIVESKAFDNGLGFTTEGVLFMDDEVADEFARRAQDRGAAVLHPDDTERLRNYAFTQGRLNPRDVGRSATWIAEQVGLRVANTTTVLLAPFDLVVADEPLTHQSRAPILGVARVQGVERAAAAARSVIGPGGSPTAGTAVIHSRDRASVMAFAAGVPVRRLLVNVGASGAAGRHPYLAPEALLGSTRISYDGRAEEALTTLAGLDPWTSPTGPVPPYPVPSNAQPAGPP